MESSKVTIISVFYNREGTVRESIQSLVKQSYSNLEIILIDDNSKDNTLQILKEFENEFDNVRVIHNNPNKGFTNSLISTISDLDSKYIAIHGSGDISLPDRVSTQVKFLENNPEVGVVTVGVTNRDVNNVFDKTNEITLQDLLKKNMINHGAVMFRKDKYDEAGGYRSIFRTRQDKDLWFRMSFVCKIYFIPEKLYTWVKQEESVSKNSFINPEPFLLSEYAKHLCLERIKNGYDSYEKNPTLSQLIFDPKICLPYFYKNLYYNLYKKKIKDVKVNLDVIQQLETNKLKLLLIKLLKKVI
ncbi:glycosyltransferase [Empedobacter falsenii]